MKIRNMIAAIMAVTIMTPLAYGQNDRSDELIFNEYASSIDKSLPMGQLMVSTAKFFIDKPYVGSTLEAVPEQLVVNLRELDCMTLVETVTALSRTMKTQRPNYTEFKKKLQEARYRNGEIGDYTDRMHYTTDWVYENQRKGIVEDVTRSVGGLEFPVNVYFMSSNPNLYKQLKDNPSLVEKMKKKEVEINSRQYYYIPQDSIESLKTGIKDGDIIGFTTRNKGLDITHVGIAYWQDGRLTFIHASSAKKKVIINPEPLSDYVASIKNNDGIIVVRVK